MTEPVLTAEDRQIWNRWMRACEAWAGTHTFRRKKQHAEKLIRMFTGICDPVICWSGGKESTVLVHMAYSIGVRVPVMSLVTDIEPPGTREYMEGLATQWGVDLTIIEPPVSFWDYFVEHGEGLDIRDGLTTGTTHVGGIWDDTMGAWRDTSSHTGELWGLRAEESKGRLMNFRKRGAVYQRKDGMWRCDPLVMWSGQDVYAYCAAHDVPLHPLYKCVRFHQDDPSRVRKAMWIPFAGGKGAFKGATWLRHYYPSLYQKLVSAIPSAGQFA